MTKQATDAAKRKAAEEGVEVESVEGTGSGGQVTARDVDEAVSEGEAKFLAFANPALGSHSVKVYEGGDPNSPRVFYRNPGEHPEGPEAQMVTEEEFAAINFDVGGVPVLARKGE